MTVNWIYLGCWQNKMWGDHLQLWTTLTLFHIFWFYRPNTHSTSQSTMKIIISCIPDIWNSFGGAKYQKCSFSSPPLEGRVAVWLKGVGRLSPSMGTRQKYHFTPKLVNSYVCLFYSSLISHYTTLINEDHNAAYKSLWIKRSGFRHFHIHVPKIPKNITVCVPY